MKLLVLGGTIFLGRHLVEAALKRGHEVTLFNRGQHNPDLFPGVEKLWGDRDGGLDVLRGRQWDAVIDTSGYVPRLVQASAELLAGAVDHYTLISSISVYAEFGPDGTDESASVHILPDPTVEEIKPETYGGLKALCEQAVEAAMPGRVLNVRAGLIVGPYDQVNRFPYWLKRIAQGGEVLAPGQPERHIQVIDGRDLAEWIIRMSEEKVGGVYNVTGATTTLTMQELLETICTVSGSGATLTWVDNAFLLEQGIAPFDGLPFWVPEEVQGVFKTNVDRAIAAGLTFRPIAETVQDTLTWLNSQQAADEVEAATVIRLRSGISLDREAALLQEWHKR